MADWYYLDASNERHQVSDSDLISLVRAGTISRQTHLWTSGQANWLPAGQLKPQLFGDTAAPPPVPQGTSKRSHEVDFEIFGDDMQLVEVELDPGEVCIAEAGAMNYLDPGISFEAKMGDGSKPDQGFWGKVGAIGGRMITGESIFMTHFTNAGAGKQRVAFSAPYPGKIIPIDLATLGGDLICQKDAFLCAAMGTSVSVHLNRKLGSGLFGGEGFILQKLSGDGLAFVHAGGTIVKKELRGETLRVDTGCIVAYDATVSSDIQRAGNLKSMMFGGEGLFLATLSGHGTVWLQVLRSTTTSKYPWRFTRLTERHSMPM
ncbi:MAG: AIM24 family protein [Verrucomicrobiota bacterium]